MKNLKKIILRTEYSRRFPDPLNKSETEIYNIEHHILLMKAKDVPAGISLDPNPRDQKPDKGIYRKVRESLEDSNEPTFHLKNKGITIFAKKVEISEDKKVITAYLGEGDGIADGGHTYSIICEANSDNSCPENQFVKIEIITGVENDDKVDISGGLNTGVQVQEASLMNLKGDFDWVEEEIRNRPYASKIAYKQNQDGPFDIRDLVAFMTIFNISHPKLLGKHPKQAYTSKAACLKLYEDAPESYEMLRPILHDILVLHDYINLNLGEKYNEKTKEEKGNKGRAYSMKGIFRYKPKDKFVFIAKESDYKLFDGVFFPIFGAMRYLVKQNGDFYAWKFDSFEEVKDFFDEIAPQLLKATYAKSVSFKNKPNSVGKDESHWDHLYDKVKTAYLEHLHG